MLRNIASLLEIPPEYLLTTRSESLLLCSTGWIEDLIKNEQVPEKFPLLPQVGSEVASILAKREIPPSLPTWTILRADFFEIKDDTVAPMIGSLSQNVDYLAFPEVLQFVKQCNAVNLTNQAKKRFAPSTRTAKSANARPWLLEMRRVLWTLYPDQPVVNLSPSLTELIQDDAVNDVATTENSFVHCLLPLRCSVISDIGILLLYEFEQHNLSSATKFSPVFLGSSHTKLHFVAYQIVKTFKIFQDLNLYIGEVQMKDFMLLNTLNVRLMPRLRNVLIAHNDLDEVANAKDHLTPARDNEAGTDSICDIVERWVEGRVSNLDYILYLNKLSGRRPGDPNFHPVVPWVTDFASKQGNLRDLTKSKFRLNKGDELLDRTYESGNHHVTAMLSEITYYTYMARITDKQVLCKHVRPSWVPEEYPRSMQRLQEWSPDEAVPEFYQDPRVFSSIHTDLPDLELPVWTESPEQFIFWHRGILESDQVSRYLHSWIDLTFGYKLSGQAAIRNKNVCLDYVDTQCELKDRGLLQLFTQPHPIRQVGRTVAVLPSRPFVDVLVTDADLEQCLNEAPAAEKRNTIVLPPDYNPCMDIHNMESLHSFWLKTDVHGIRDKTNTDDNINRHNNYLLKVKPMQVLGCIIAELYFPKKFRALGDEPSFESRYRNAVDLILREEKSVSFSVRRLLRRLLLATGSKRFLLDPSDRYPTVSDEGLPLPSAELLLDPLLGGYFSPVFEPILQTIDTVETINYAARYADTSALDALAEFQVKLTARQISPLLHQSTEDIVELVVPLYQSLVESPRTAVQACWHLLDHIGVVLGPNRTKQLFLDLVTSHYKSLHTTKHIKLYHRSFMLVLMTRLKMSVFLDSFCEILIEATGGNREYPDTPAPTPGDNHQLPATLALESDVAIYPEGEIFSFDNWDTAAGGKSKTGVSSNTLTSIAQNLKHQTLDSVDVFAPVPFTVRQEHNNSAGRKENSVVQISKETLLWLSHRLGPVLTARHISRNLLRMMSLCFLPPEGLEPTDQHFADQQIRITSNMMSGDSLSVSVLECLRCVAELYGDHVVLVQYLPYCWELAGLCRRKVTQNLEGGLLGSLAVLHSVIPLLSDSILMKELDNITSQILCPVIHASTSTHNVFTTGPRIRSALVYKSLDVLYLLGLRIGEEMSRTHLTDLVAGFFTSFSKVFDDTCVPRPERGDGEPAFVSCTELTDVLTKKLAYTVYISFHLLLGGSHLEETVPNIGLIKKLCLEYQTSLTIPAVRPLTYREIQHTLPYVNTSLSGSGNMIIINSASAASDDEPTSNTSEVSKLIHNPPGNTARHLRGNWLAYWEHELVRSDQDGFSLKQIRLQSWTGHQGSVKSLAVLDNENSFLSGGKDRSVRLWSLRNCGEGEYSCNAQWIYTGHRKPVFSVGYMSQRGLAVSCDGLIHVWDPYVGGLISEFDGLRGNPYSVMTPQAHSQCVVAASSEGNLALIDTRMKTVYDLKVSYGLVGLIRSICCSEDGNFAAVGHSSGYISIMDLRTGRVRSGMKAHDSEVLTLTSGPTYFVTTSLDQTASVYQWDDAKLWTHLRTPAEPLHCVCTYGEQIITGSTNHKISVHSIHRQRESNTVVSKLRSDIIRGNLIQMEILPQNRLLVLGTDMGSIHLIC